VALGCSRGPQAEPFHQPGGTPPIHFYAWCQWLWAAAETGFRSGPSASPKATASASIASHELRALRLSASHSLGPAAWPLCLRW